MTDGLKKTFLEELKELLIKHEMGEASDTPDFIVAEYLYGCLDVFGQAARHRNLKRGLPVVAGPWDWLSFSEELEALINKQIGANKAGLRSIRKSLIACVGKVDEEAEKTGVYMGDDLEYTR